MVNFIEKYRIYLGLGLILIILLGSGILLWQRKIGNFSSKNQNTELADLQAENQDLKDRIAKLELSINSTNNSESGVVKSAESPSAKATGDKLALVNINTADEKALDALPGIGPAKAKAIIDYRDSYGNFKTTQDIIKVSGIGQSTYEKLKDMISVE